MAKRFDMDGNGVLDADEQEVGRFIMAQEFFKRHEKDVSLFGGGARRYEEEYHTLATSRRSRRPSRSSMSRRNISAISSQVTAA